MLLIEDSNKGYEIDNRKIPGGAYADDMVLHTNRNSDLQALMYLTSDYFNFVGLKIAADGRDKTIYTNNVDLHIYDIYFRDEDHNPIKIPFYTSSESYKYLGLWINLELN